MKVLMFGWEFPPYFAGGVGIVCFELSKALADLGVSINYVMPFAPDDLNSDFLNIIDASRCATDKEVETSSIKMTRVPSLMAAYQTVEEYEQMLIEVNKQNHTVFGKKAGSRDPTRKMYGDNLLEEINMFAERVAVMVQKGMFDDFDVIHAHDWTTIKAAKIASQLTGKPLIVHVHITEVNKNAGAGVTPEVYAVEREGFMAADKVIAISGCIKDTLMQHYGIPEEKIEVIHNGGVTVDPVEFETAEFKGDNKIVSYLGRITGMKGPENFVEVASKVLSHCPKTKFIMAGSGDKLQACIDKTHALGIFDKFYFPGFYTRKDSNLFFDISDVFVLPSLMEPFGLTPLEAMGKETPTIVSKQSGVSEILTNCFKVDFWDLDKMASQIISLLKYPVLHKTMKAKGVIEARNTNWTKPARLCAQLYARMAHG